MDTFSPTKLFGSVEVCIDESWIAVCNEFWDDRDASVICRQLGYSSDGTYVNVLLSRLFWRSKIELYAFQTYKKCYDLY